MKRHAFANLPASRGFRALTCTLLFVMVAHVPARAFAQAASGQPIAAAQSSTATKLANVPDSIPYEANPYSQVPQTRTMSTAIKNALENAGIDPQQVSAKYDEGPAADTVTLEGNFQDGDIIVTGKLVNGRIVLTKQFKPLLPSGVPGAAVMIPFNPTPTTAPMTTVLRDEHVERVAREDAKRAFGNDAAGWTASKGEDGSITVSSPDGQRRAVAQVVRTSQSARVEVQTFLGSTRILVLPPETIRKYWQDLFDEYRKKAARIEGDRDEQGRLLGANGEVVPISVQVALLMQRDYISQGLDRFADDLIKILDSPRPAKVALLTNLRAKAEELRRAHADFESAKRDYELNGELAQKSARERYQNTLAEARKLDAKGWKDDAREMFERAEKDTYGRYLATRARYIALLNETRVLGLQKDGVFLYDALANVSLTANPTNDPRTKTANDQLYVDLLDSYLGPAYRFVPGSDRIGIRAIEHQALGLRATWRLDGLTPLASPAYAGAQDSFLASKAGGGSDVPIALMNELRGASGGLFTSWTDEAWDKTLQSDAMFVLLTWGGGILAFLVRAALVIGLAMSAGQVVSSGNDLYVAYSDLDTALGRAPGAGFDLVVTAQENVDQKEWDFVKVTSLAALDGVLTYRAVRPRPTGGQGGADPPPVPVKVTERGPGGDPPLSGLRSVQRGAEKARKLGVDGDAVDAVFRMAGQDNATGTEAANWLASIDKIDDLVAGARAAGVPEAEIAAIFSKAQQKTKTARILALAEEVPVDLLRATLNKRGVTLVVDNPYPGKVKLQGSNDIVDVADLTGEKHRQFWRNLPVTNTIRADTVALWDIRGKLDFMRNGYRVTWSPFELQQLGNVMKRGDLSEVYVFVSDEMVFLKFLNDDQIAFGRSFLQHPNRDAIASGRMLMPPTDLPPRLTPVPGTPVPAKPLDTSSLPTWVVAPGAAMMPAVSGDAPSDPLRTDGLSPFMQNRQAQLIKKLEAERDRLGWEIEAADAGPEKDQLILEFKGLDAALKEMQDRPDKTSQPDRSGGMKSSSTPPPGASASPNPPSTAPESKPTREGAPPSPTGVKTPSTAAPPASGDKEVSAVTIPFADSIPEGPAFVINGAEKPKKTDPLTTPATAATPTLITINLTTGHSFNPAILNDAAILALVQYLAAEGNKITVPASTEPAKDRDPVHPAWLPSARSMLEGFASSLLPPRMRATWRGEPSRLVSASRAATSQQGQSAATSSPPVKIILTSTGRSSGDAFQMTVLNEGPVPVTLTGDSFVLEPVADVTQATVDRELAQTPKAGRVTSTLTAYCLEFLKQRPSAGMLFRLAPEAVQRRFANVARLFDASRRLRDAGKLRPGAGDPSDPASYFDDIRQWAIWTQEQGFDEKGYGRAFTAHSRKNVEAAGHKWTRELEKAFTGLASGRWQAVQMVLREAAAR